MSGIGDVRGTGETQYSAQPGHVLTDKESLMSLGELRNTVHKTAVQMANFEPPFTAKQTFLKSLMAGAVVTIFCPPLGVAIVGLGIASAVLEGALTLGINTSGELLANFTRPSDNQIQP